MLDLDLTLKGWRAATVIIVVLLAGLLIGYAAAADEYVSRVTVTTDAVNLAKVEAKAIEILRRVGTVTGEAMTLAQARAYIKPEGVLNVRLCLDLIVIDRLRGIAQARVVGTRVEYQPATEAQTQ